MAVTGVSTLVMLGAGHEPGPAPPPLHAVTLAQKFGLFSTELATAVSSDGLLATVAVRLLTNVVLATSCVARLPTNALSASRADLTLLVMVGRNVGAASRVLCRQFWKVALPHSADSNASLAASDVRNVASASRAARTDAPRLVQFGSSWHSTSDIAQMVSMSTVTQAFSGCATANDSLMARSICTTEPEHCALTTSSEVPELMRK